MKKLVYIGLVILIIFLILPYILWQTASERELEVLIIDKTVPDQSYSKHNGLVWAMNFNKYVKEDENVYDVAQDYVGFVPLGEDEYEIRRLEEANADQYNLIYLADLHGVYEEEFYEEDSQEEASSLIYGGVTLEELTVIKNALFKNQIPLVAEYNSFASLPDSEARQELIDLLGVEWTGWTGSYFNELNPDNNNEIAPWMVENYEQQNEESWEYNDGGFILLREDGEIVVLEEEKDVNGRGIEFAVTDMGEEFFGQDITSRYKYWFDILIEKDADTLANYTLDVTEAGSEKLEEYSIPSVFPAVTRSVDYGMPIYYFAGAYGDNQSVPSFYQYHSLDRILGGITGFQKDQGDSFYYRAYLPMMEKILEESYQLKHETRIAAVEEFQEEDITYNSRIQENGFEVYHEGEWKEQIIKGVNMGMAKPGLWPGEAGISFEEYYQWFDQIAAMGANNIRVYTIHPPVFYQALWLYNENAPSPMYVTHGIWIEEEPLEETLDAFTPEIVETFEREMQDVVDVIHGNASIEEKAGHAYGEYIFDVSPYVSAYILGIEWYPIMVERTNDVHQDLEEFEGDYFYTENGEAFEKWLAARMDFITAYEMENYSKQRPVSFTNWPTTDLLEHPAEPSEDEDLVSVDPNHIYPTEAFKAGYFASYHVYPYYPEFLNYEPEYLNFTDHRGENNNYAGYLNDLIEEHDMPVIIAEFGVPSSRGKTHENPFGWNQGNISEKEQGEIGVRLFEDMLAQGAAGGMIFTWQDEWFKRTWNTMELDNPDRRPYWSNVQTNEQRFGLLSFETNKKPLDGELEKWEEDYKLYENDDGILNTLYMDHDEAYLYLMLEFEPEALTEEDSRVYLFLNTIEDQGNETTPFVEGLTFDKGIDFAIEISSEEEDSRVWVDQYYDPFYYQYGYKLKFLPDQEVLEKNTGVFSRINLALSQEMLIPSTGLLVPFDYYETGKLKEGIGNPEASDYDSLADYYIHREEGRLEIRIPWMLLNFRDPSHKEIMGDLWEEGLPASKNIQGIEISAAMNSSEELLATMPRIENDSMEQELLTYQWEDWETPEYSERLKESYYIFQEFFQNHEND